jgi:hypothetical protein
MPGTVAGDSQAVFGGAASKTLGPQMPAAGTGHVALTGYFQGTADFGGQSLTSAGSTDMYLLRLDP